MPSFKKSNRLRLKILYNSILTILSKNLPLQQRNTNDILYKLLDDFAKLSDGEYDLDLNDVVFDKQGKVAYYDSMYCGIEHRDRLKPIPITLRREIKDKLISLLRESEFTPVSFENKDVAYCMLCPFIEKTIVVKDHKVTVL